MLSQGTLRYSPLINGSLNRRDGGTTKWWLVIDVDPEIGAYYRELFHLDSYKTKKMRRPAWEAHISVIRNEPPPIKTPWYKYNGKPIEFEYHHKPIGDGIYIWLPVICEEALDIREELGLPREPFYSLHLTVGNLKEERDHRSLPSQNSLVFPNM